MRPRVFYGWVVVATLCAVNVAIQATGTLNFGLFVLPMGTELGMSRSLIGWAQTARSLAGGVSSFNLGRLLDQHGARFLVAAAALVTGLGLVGLGFIHEVWQLFLLFALVGLVGLSAPGGLLTSVPVAKWFVRQRGRAMSVATVGFGVGAVAFLPITQLLIAGLGWRGAWVVLGIVSTAIIVPLSLLFLRRQPEDMGLAPDGEATPRTVGAHSPRQEEPAWTAGEALRTATLWKLTLAFMLVGFGMGGAGVHRIPYWVERGFNPQLVSYSFAADAAA
ncbi:MAG: MFS transporter, partial [Chloroflexi bacterium]|nr:MFS transporter [Chloroflexota bacterium]